MAKISWNYSGRRIDKKVQGLREFDVNYLKKDKNSIYICAAGFEERSRAFVRHLSAFRRKMINVAVVLQYSVHKSDNQPTLDFFDARLPGVVERVIKNVVVDVNNIYTTRRNIEHALRQVDVGSIESIFIDISGMTNFLILLVMNIAQRIFIGKRIVIFYTEAQAYYPPADKAASILRLVDSKEENDIQKLGDELGASGARDVIILPDFKGSFTADSPICLIFFVGYEPSRAAGLLDAYRPNLLVVCYGESPHAHFVWRKEFSKKLHKTIFQDFERVETTISTFHIKEIVDSLQDIYKSIDNSGSVLYEKYNVAVTPQCSKLQAVATFLFAKMHPDVQIVFCLPGKFNPKRYSNGIGKLWQYELQ